MSYIAVIVGVVILIVGNITNWVAAAILLAKSKQSKDPTTKRALLAAFYFSLLTIPFTIVLVVGGGKALATRGCRKHPRWFLIFAIVFIIIALIVVNVITRIYSNKAAAAGDSATVRDLTSAGRLLISALILNIIGFIILYIVIGRKFARIGKECRAVRKQVNKAKQIAGG